MRNRAGRRKQRLDGFMDGILGSENSDGIEQSTRLHTMVMRNKS